MGHRIHSVAYRDPQTILIVDDDEINRGCWDTIDR